MSKGIYNQKYFENHPEEREIEATLYCVILVNKKTLKRECIKIGIAKGKGWQTTLKRSRGFTFHDIRIQKTVVGNLEDVFFLEDYLHEMWSEYRYRGTERFGGHTELFDIDKLKDILESIPDKV